MYFPLLNTSLKMAKKGQNVYEVYHRLYINVSNYSAVAGMYINCVPIIILAFHT
jgi:hypothetical protein